MAPLRLLWPECNAWKLAAGAYGMALHVAKMKEALEAAGVIVTRDPSDDSDLALQFENTDNFRPVMGKRNVFFTTCEMSTPVTWRENIRTATAVVGQHSKTVLSEFYPGDIFVCPEGVDSLRFPFFQREAPSPGEPFRFLFVGYLADDRKGYWLVLEAWKRWKLTGRMPKNAQLYVKGSGRPGGTKMQGQGFVIDERNLTGAELAALYNSAHAFLLPSLGEAWGLTLTEAMSTGAPCIWTAYSAPLDYGDSAIGYPITDFQMISLVRPEGRLFEGRREPPPLFGAAANPDAIIRRMEEIIADYPAALARGKAASERMHSQYTWAQSAVRFIEICEKVMELPIIPARKVMAPA